MFSCSSACSSCFCNSAFKLLISAWGIRLAAKRHAMPSIASRTSYSSSSSSIDKETTRAPTCGMRVTKCRPSKRRMASLKGPREMPYCLARPGSVILVPGAMLPITMAS